VGVYGFVVCPAPNSPVTATPQAPLQLVLVIMGGALGCATTSRPSHHVKALRAEPTAPASAARARYRDQPASTSSPESVVSRSPLPVSALEVPRDLSSGLVVDDTRSLTPREQGFITYVSQGLTIYKPPSCTPWRVVPKTRSWGQILRDTWALDRMTRSYSSYSFSDSGPLKVDFISSGETTYYLDGSQRLSASPSLGRSPVDLTVTQPLGGIPHWYTSRAACMSPARG